jgi:hypothetical protein
VRVVLALTALCFALGMLQKGSCFEDSWQDGDARYTHMCYSDLPYLYTGRGFAELEWPYDDDPQVRRRYDVMEYPVGISYYAWATAWVTHWMNGSPDLAPRFAQRADALFSGESVSREVRYYVIVNSLGFAAVALLSAFRSPGSTRTGPGTPRSSRSPRRWPSTPWSTGTCWRSSSWPARCGPGPAGDPG